MSLLLDALQRASRDKEKALAGAVPGKVAASGELHLKDAQPGDASFPHLLHEAEPVPAVLHLTPSAAPRMEPAVELTLEAPLAPLRKESSEVVDESPASAVLEADSSPAPASEKKPASGSPAVPLAANHAQMAQNIRRAHGQDGVRPAHARRRVWILGGVAVVLMLGLGGLFFVGLEAPHSPLTAPSQPSEALRAQAPAPLVAAESAVQAATGTPPSGSTAVPRAPSGGPIISQAKTGDGSSRAASATTGVVATALPSAAASAPVATPLASTKVASPLSLAGNEVALRGAVSKQGVLATVAGPSPLEGAYSALLGGRLEEATRLYGQVLGRNPEERDALLGLAYIAQQKGLRDESQAYYRRVLRQEPGNTIANAALLALDAEVSASPSSRQARELATRQPDSTLALSTAGNALVRDGLLADAAQFFERAQMLEPASPLHVYNHAVALDRLGHSALAAVQYQRVLSLADKSPPAAARGFALEAVRQRLEQLRQALATRTEVNP